MMGTLLPICAILFSTLLTIIYFSKERVNLLENKMYSIMIVSTLFIGVFEFVLQCFPLIGVNEKTELWISIINKIDFIFMISVVNSLFFYTIIITIPSVKNNFHKILGVFLLLDVIVYIFILLGDVRVIESNGNFGVEGNAINFNFTLCGLYILLSIVVSFINIKKIDKRHIPIFSMTFILIVLLIIFKINPYIVMISVTATFINYIMYFTIENPDMKMVEQLARARDDADRANRAKTDFLSSMSHEIRTPLNAIVGFSDCIVNSDNLSDAKENARDIVNASKTLLEIVNGILDISKIESGKLELVNVSYDARFTFKELATMIAPKAEEKGLKFSFYLAPDIPPVLYGDVNNVKKIITNLLSNAVKYTDKGFIRYEITCVNEGDTSRLMISVEDSGRGIKKDAVDKLFSKFQRLDEDKNSTIEGTGLGLAITKQLVDLMNGQIAVHTVYGTGSKFTVMIPQKISDEVIKVEEPEEEKKVVKKVVTLEEAKILLVDDNNLNLKVASKLLEREGATNITCVNSGFDCLDKISAGEKFDLIFMDDMMPKMSGRETFLKLREIPGFVTPVIALTANAISGAKEEYLELGFNEYLAKPIEKEELVRVLSSVLKPKEDEYSNVTVVENEELEKGAPSKEEYLRSNGVMIDKALETLGDMNVYEVTLKDFLQSIDARWENVKKYKESGDLENYSSELRSIKSDCKYLGFTKLANTCFLHELKSKDGDKEYIAKHFVDLEDAYNVALKIMKGV